MADGINFADFLTPAGTVGGLFLIAKLLWAKVDDNDKKCNERNNRLEEKFDASQTFIQTTMVDALDRVAESNRDTKAELRNLRHALVEKEFVPSDAGQSGVHHTPPDPPSRNSKSGHKLQLR